MKTADLMDVYQEELQSCEIQFRNFGGRKAFWGPCQTLQCRNDNVLLKQMLASDGGGAVLIVDGGGSLRTALIGDNMAEIGRRNHWAGVVIHGAVRDTLALAELDFGVKALGSNPRKSRKNGEGRTNISVSFGGITVKPGDWACSDEDGIVIAGRALSLDTA